MDTKSPQEATIVVWSQVQNQPMERFAVLRALTRRAKPASRSRFVGSLPAEPAEDNPNSRLAGILVLLVPVAALAWAAIGLFVYGLIT